MSAVERLVARWRADPAVGGNVTAWRQTPAAVPQLAPLPDDLHPALAASLQRSGITALYSHQAEAWRAIRAGEHCAVVTGTASGKTLCYNLPVLQALLQEPAARALYLFPTKALGQDQLAALQGQLAAIEAPAAGTSSWRAGPLRAAIYDGDTSQAARPAIRQQARLVISNPDMLHTGILPHHTRWAEFFAGLRFVVIDEMHVYRGVFGSHVANVLRRLRRIARHYGAAPQFILTSATIANPGELAGKLVEGPVKRIERDGSPHGPRHFLIYNPPVVDPGLGLRRSALQESVRLAEDLLAAGIQAILFARSRRSVEVILTYLRDRAGAALPAQPSAAAIIRGYRSGYLPAQRREIERGLRSGQVRAVVATNALELGVDIGGMGASLLVGYPGTVAALRQQAGRAGRGMDSALAALVTTAAPLDQFLAAHPDYLFERSPEGALLNPDNLLILLAHLRCAAFELPFLPGDGFGSVPPALTADFLEFLAAQGELHRSGDRYFWMADAYPAQATSLRSASAEAVTLQEEGDSRPATVGMLDRESAAWLAHPGAVYLHEGQTYLVENLDLETGIAHLRREDSDYYTEPRAETTLALIGGPETAAGTGPGGGTLTQAAVPGGLKAWGELRVTSQVSGYRKIRWFTHETLGLGEVSLPPFELQTAGYWIALDEASVEQLREQGLWNNDPNAYGPAWIVQRERARARDGFRCQVCGALEQGRAHDVHHKTPFRSFPSPDQANRLENLITLCPACHRRAEAAVRMRSGLAGLGYVLGELAPLFLMCDPGDLGMHTDPQSPLAGGQPIAAIYERAPGGIGFSQRLFELHSELVGRALELVAACRCSEGCPSCVGPGGENGVGGKAETLAILRLLA